MHFGASVIVLKLSVTIELIILNFFVVVATAALIFYIPNDCICRGIPYSLTLRL